MIRRAQRPDTGYTTLSNDPPNDPHLSYGAKGMLWYLLSKPEGWQAKMSILFEASSEKEHATRTIFKELEESGYVQRFKHFNEETGRVEWDYIVFDSPQAVQEPAPTHQESPPATSPPPATGNPPRATSPARRTSEARPARVTQSLSDGFVQARSAGLLASPAAPASKGQVYDFSQGLPERVVEYLRKPQCRWHWAEDLAIYLSAREMGDPSSYMIGVIAGWIRGDRGRPPDRDLPTTTRPHDPNAERRRKMLGKT